MHMRIRAQSAMEYLTTYGWAILIIAVVLGALFELGVFSGYYFTPKLPPGSCIVSRPYGVRSLQGIGLEGNCGGGIPEYTFSADYNVPPGDSIFNYGKTLPNYGGEIMIPYNKSSSLMIYNFTISFWLKEYSGAPDISCCNGDFLLFYQPERILIYRDWTPRGTTRVTGTIYNSSVIANPNVQQPNVNYCSNASVAVGTYTWNLWAFTFNGTELTGYVNGKQFCSTKVSGKINPIPTVKFTYTGLINGSESNLQVYSTALSANYISAEYREGIGGAPINLQNLAGWYPLNGNARDYSGNDENGNAISGIFSNAWESGYTQP